MPHHFTSVRGGEKEKVLHPSLALRVNRLDAAVVGSPPIRSSSARRYVKTGSLECSGSVHGGHSLDEEATDIAKQLADCDDGEKTLQSAPAGYDSTTPTPAACSYVSDEDVEPSVPPIRVEHLRTRQ